MDQRTAETTLSLTKFGVGQPVTRKEDPTLVQGHGRYNDDISLPRQAHAWMLRSSEAHGIINSIDAEAAKTMPGVLAVLTADDLKAYGGLKCSLPLKSRDGSPIKYVPKAILAADRVRYVGDAIVCVIAETVAQAKDAAETIVLDIEPLPAVVSARDAAQPGAPQLYDEVPNNIALDWQYGDSAKVAAALDSSAHVVSLPLINQRLVVASMEPRSAIGEYTAGKEHWTLHSASQGVFGMKNMLRDILNTTPDKVRVLTGNVGGSFGMKATVYPEYICILHASKVLGRPVKWTDDRSGSFMSDHQGRDFDMTVDVGFDKDGLITAMRLSGYGNLGAFCSAFGPMLPTLNIMKNAISMYRTPLLEVATKCVFSNTTHVSAYRGAGRPEGALSIERTMDIAANELGIDKLELRRRNFIKVKDMPFATPAGTTYDCGDFPGLFKAALDQSDYKGFAKRKRDSKKAGKLRGFGVACYVETTAAMTTEQGGIRFDEDGSVTIITGTLDYGQGHASSFAQVLTDKLGIPFDKIKLMQGDSDLLVAGGGTGGSRSVTMSGTAIVQASDKVIDSGKQLAAHVLEASSGDIEFKNGTFTIAGTDRSIEIMELAAKLRTMTLPDNVPKTLDITHVTEQTPGTYPNGVHVVEVEIDPETGLTRVVKYNAVNDFGTVINPLMIEGQVHGGILQGLGQVLLEGVVHDTEGQLVTGSFMDYAMPRAHDAPMIAVANRPIPTKTNPLGSKGCGEAGTSGGLPAVANAVMDALSDYNIRNLEMPMTASKIWEAIETAKATQKKSA